MVPSQSTLIPAILATLKEIVTQEVYYKIGPQNESTPFLTFDVISDVIDIKTFEHDFYKIALQVNVWGESKEGTVDIHSINDDIHSGLNRYEMTVYCDDFLEYSNRYIFSTINRGQCDIDKEYVHIWSEYEIDSLDS